MILTSYGDLAQNFYLRTRNAELKSNVNTLGQELSTGKSADLTTRLGGDFTMLADVEHKLVRLNSFETATTEASLFAAAAQGYLEKIQDNATDLSSNILAMNTNLTEGIAEQMSFEARQHLENSISALNGGIGGRKLFAGTATDTSPLRGTDIMMSALAAEISGLTTVADIQTAVDDWFSDPTGFDAIMYQGSSNSLAPIQVGPDDHVTMDIRADDDDLKYVLKSFALGALVADPAVSIAADVKVELIRSTGMELIGAQDKLTGLRSEIGFTEGRIDEVRSRNQASKTSLSLTFNSLVEADPYETFTRLEEAQAQLESLYTVTVRSSQLSLLRFMS